LAGKLRGWDALPMDTECLYVTRVTFGNIDTKGKYVYLHFNDVRLNPWKVKPSFLHLQGIPTPQAHMKVVDKKFFFPPI